VESNPAAIDDFVIDDLVITTGGVDVVSSTKFKKWAAAFMAKINDLQFEVIETFQNEDGSRVASRWRIPAARTSCSGPLSSFKKTRRRGPLVAVRGVQIHGGFDESLQGLLVDLVALVEVDGTPYITLETRVKEA